MAQRTTPPSSPPYKVNKSYPGWSEIYDSNHELRPMYSSLLNQLDQLPRKSIRQLEENLEATMREMGVSFDITHGVATKAWNCDILPQIFTASEWKTIQSGIQQRLLAFEHFLSDIYGAKHIFNSGTLPVEPILSSPFYQRAAVGLPRPNNCFLHLTGTSLCRTAEGALAVKQHYFSNASGMSYMMQNRRALTRVIPRYFHELSIRSIAETPVSIMEMLRSYAKGTSDPSIILLSPGLGHPAYSEHSFLARRMGIPLVQGSDLVVIRDTVFLKAISGLEPVHVIYTRVADPWLDPLAFRSDSLIGVPGLVNCIRQGNVQVVNTIGSRLSDDRSLLRFAPQIIRYYLQEEPILNSLETHWLGNTDDCEHVLNNLDAFTVRPLYGERILTPPPNQPFSNHRKQKIIQEVRQHPHAFVAQPRSCDALTICFSKGKKVEHYQDHIIFARRMSESSWEVFPSALTRVSTKESPYVASALGGGSKDTWVEGHVADAIVPGENRWAIDIRPPHQLITSHVAEAFYWTGRYFERAFNLANMISTIESLELEELTPTERQLYRPVWNQMLPPLENRTAGRKRSLANLQSRYRLTLDPNEPGSVISSVLRAISNGETLLECLSTETWGVISSLRAKFPLSSLQPSLPDDIIMHETREACDAASQMIPRFFGVAEATMIKDGGWWLCLVGQTIERAIITANALVSIAPFLSDLAHSEHALEIRLSGFLRLLASRDAYRRIYQTRIEPIAVLDLLVRNSTLPRSLLYCFIRCKTLISQLAPLPKRSEKILTEIDSLLHQLSLFNWPQFLQMAPPNASSVQLLPQETPPLPIIPALSDLMERTLTLHDLIADSFLHHYNHLN